MYNIEHIWSPIVTTRSELKQINEDVDFGKKKKIEQTGNKQRNYFRCLFV